MNQKIDIRDSLTQTIAGKEFFEFVCGDLVGYGIHRAVFSYNPDPSCVIKYQYQPSFQNMKEWELWNDLSMSGHANHLWLAPCVSISENGIWLVQKRTKPLPENYKLPVRVPHFMTDLKRSNFGLYKGRLVMHDYANHLCSNYAIDNRTKKAEWF